MRAGAAEIDITPSAGIELSGFVARKQPSLGVHDPLYARAVYLDDEQGGRLVWINADLIGLGTEACDSIRKRIASALGLACDRVVVSATHTHSGPPTILLNNCGSWDPADDSYRMTLVERLAEAGTTAARSPEPVELTFGQSVCDVNHDRRGFASSHVDHLCSCLGLRRPEGSYLAVMANYACHPVALGGENRMISRDIFGFAADHVAAQLPGKPIVLLTNGACGNLNPPRTGIVWEECEAVGKRIGTAILDASRLATRLDGPICAKGERIDVEPEAMTLPQIRDRAEGIRDEIRRWNNAWVDRAIDSTRKWETWMLQNYRPNASIDLRVHCVTIGDLKIACVGAEAFSILGDILRSRCGSPLFVAGYANGEMGYLCPRTAYPEAGYEVANAYVYYNSPPVKIGEFERTADHLTQLFGSLE
ncbi:MAG: neutral/alkaline non-lysosomal ceramidase N-terminal domain-containing protein [Fimbriimonas sp.]|nr:neutral/alkaline non-lysosomal ceramidase N-terminal domain-containing protein [Fimbriimonas sp.]